MTLTVWCRYLTFKPLLSMANRLAVLNTIALVFLFFRLRMRSFSLNQSANKFKLSDKCDSIISMLLLAMYNMVSLACLKMREFLRTFTISFAKIISNKGPKMDLCGMPQVTKAD